MPVTVRQPGVRFRTVRVLPPNTKGCTVKNLASFSSGIRIADHIGMLIACKAHRSAGVVSVTGEQI